MKPRRFIFLLNLLYGWASTCSGNPACGISIPGPDTLADESILLSTEEIEHLIFRSGEQEQTDAGLSEISLLSEERGSLLENPLNLNSVGAEDLRRLGFLSEWQIYDLLHYRESYGQIVHWKELLLHLASLDTQSIRRLQGFCFLGPTSTARTKGGKVPKAKHQLSVRYGRNLYRTEAYEKSRYAGPPRQCYFKYAYNQQNRVLLGFAAQQDAGEAFGKGGFDAYSGYFCLKETGPFKNICIGNYRIYWGYGLATGHAGSYFVSRTADRLRCSGTGITPHASGAEYGFLQGLAGSLKLPREWQLDVFFSDRKIDGRMDRNPNRFLPPENKSGILFWESLSSLSENGYHRTESELANKGKIRWQQTGWKAEKAFSRFRIGTTLSLYRFGGIYNPPAGKRTVSDPPSIPQDGNASLFQPDPLLQALGGNLSFFFQYLSSCWHLFGEYAYGTPRGLALLQGLQWKPTETFALSAVYRHFGLRYFSPYAQTPNSRAVSPSHPGKAVDNLQWQISCPLGNRLLLSLRGEGEKERAYPELPLYTYRIGGVIDHKGKFLSSSLDLALAESKTRKGFSLRIKTEGTFSCGIFFQSLFESRNLGRGLLLLQDIGYGNPKGNFLIRLRTALFHTDGYPNRIYAYEHDVLHAASAPALYGKGCRLALSAKQKIGKGLWLELKYAHTLYDGVQVRGNGDNTARTPIRPEIKAQIRWKFQSRSLLNLP